MLDYEGDWAKSNSPGQEIARWCCLPKAELIMRHENQSSIMFQAGDKVYFWFPVSDLIHENFSEGLDKIV